MEISGVFPVKCRIVLISRDIRGDFPLMHSINPHFHVFWSNKQNSSLYLSKFLLNLFIKGNFSVYLLNNEKGGAQRSVT